MSRKVAVRCRCGKARRATPQQLVGWGWRKTIRRDWFDRAKSWTCDYCRANFRGNE